MFALLCWKVATAPISVGGGPPGIPFATPTPLSTSTWTSPNGIPFGVGGPVPSCSDMGPDTAFDTAGTNGQASQQNAFNM
mmetsp:Transcript_36336/g.85441  ORF Transcript_36336/g.85441 Transcript_36336/m.85441 type:complete len:80 (-) Transcript_36336:16-255(-)